MKSALKSAIRLTTDLLFPPRCVHCGNDGDLFCSTCESESTKLQLSEVCRKCALPLNNVGRDVCEVCFIRPPSLDRAIAGYAFDPTIHDAVTSFKYNDIRALAPRLGEMLAQALPASVSESVDVLVPVPVSRARLRSRGYNQSALLAKHVAQAKSLTVEEKILVRKTDTRPQAGAHSQEERAANVAEAFHATGDLTDLRILLIDDVMTTGSTLNACAKALKEAGADWVGALVLAREL